MTGDELDAHIDHQALAAGDSTIAKAQRIESLGPVIGKVESYVERTIYIERIAREFGIADVGAVKVQLRHGIHAHQQHMRVDEHLFEPDGAMKFGWLPAVAEAGLADDAS